MYRKSHYVSDFGPKIQSTMVHLHFHAFPKSLVLIKRSISFNKIFLHTWNKNWTKVAKLVTFSKESYLFAKTNGMIVVIKTSTMTGKLPFFLFFFILNTHSHWPTFCDLLTCLTAEMGNFMPKSLLTLSRSDSKTNELLQ